MRRLIPSQTVIINSSGAGVGLVQTLVTKQYDQVLPFIGDYLPAPWNMLSSTGNILIGGFLFALSNWTMIIPSGPVRDFLNMYSITTLVGGLMNGLMPTSLTANPSNYVASLPGGRNGYMTHSYYPGYRGNFIRRPSTRAKGFGSDVTKNPMAAIPTTIPYNKIIA